MRKIAPRYGWFFLILFSVLLSVLACRGSAPVVPAAVATEPQPRITETAGMVVFHQWAVSGMDQWSSEDWVNALGEPVGDEDCRLFPQDAWTYHADPHLDHDFLQLFYEQPVIPTMVQIHLTYTHSAVTLVSLIDVNGVPHEVYTGEPEDLDTCPSTIRIELEGFSIPVYAVRIDVATLWDNAGITAVDAVELVELHRNGDAASAGVPGRQFAGQP